MYLTNHNDVSGFIQQEIRRLVPTAHVTLIGFDLDRDDGFTAVTLIRRDAADTFTGYAKRCYKDPPDDRIGLSIATTRALRKAGYQTVRGKARRALGIVREQGPGKYRVGVTRTGYAARDFDVQANSVDEARFAALQEAGNHSFSEHSSDYEIDFIQEMQ